MEGQVSNIFLSMWNQQKKMPLGRGPPKIPEAYLWRYDMFANV